MCISNNFLYAIFSLILISGSANAARYHDRSSSSAVTVTTNNVTLEDIITRTEAIEAINNLSPEIPNRRKTSTIGKTPIINTILDKLDKVGPVGVGIAAVVAAEAAGYLIDELQNQVMSPRRVDDVVYSYGVSQKSEYRDNPEDACADIYSYKNQETYHVTTVELPDITVPNDVGKLTCTSTPSSNVRESRITYTLTDREVYDVPVSDELFADKIYTQLPALPSPDLADLFKNEDGNWDLDQNAFDDYDDWIEDFADSQPNYHYDKKSKTLYYRQPNGGTVIVNPDGTLSPGALDWGDTTSDPSNYPDDAIDPFEETDPNESPNTGTGITTGSETTTTTNPDGTTTTSKTDSTTTIQLEFPVFCKWASVVCTFIDWMRTDPELPEPQELPHEEIDPATLIEDFDSGLGDGSCPANVVVQIGDATFEYDWSPACGVASNVIKPIFITIGLFIAAVIITGFRFKRAS